MDEMPETSRKLLDALVEIEDQAIAAARKAGCRCDQVVPGMGGRTFPYVSFDRNECIGKAFTEIPWRMMHQPDCHLEGQRGVGFANDLKCGELSPETQRPCFLNWGHSGAHQAVLGPASTASWAHSSPMVEEGSEVARQLGPEATAKANLTASQNDMAMLERMQRGNPHAG